MTSQRLRRSWNEFWGELLLVRCHQGNPARWSKREERARWLSDHLELNHGARILDLGCGDGLLDICLARRGMKVTAVDRIASVLASARREPGGREVVFVAADIRRISFPPARFDLVLMLELAGLLGREADAHLLSNAHGWLAEHGLVVVDCPRAPAQAQGISRQQFDEGRLEYRWSFDDATRLQEIVPEFHTNSGEVIELHDPYDPTRPDHVGVLRYLYPRDELADMLAGAGFHPRAVASPWREGFHLLVGEAAG